MYFEKGNKHFLLATLNLLGRDWLLYNELKLSYLELEESVKQWRSSKLLMKTSLTEKKKITGRLTEGEFLCIGYKEKKKSAKTDLLLFSFIAMVATHF